MEGQYSEKVMEHFRNPRNVGEIPDANGIGNVGNPICGDIMRLYIKVDENEIITDAKFKTFGCLPPDMEIVSADGGWTKIVGASKGMSVVNNRGEETFVAETYKRNYSGPMIDIVPFVSPYNSFSVTSNHLVLSVQRSILKKTRKSSYKCDLLRINKEELLSTKPDYVEAKYLEKGDYLVFTANKEAKDNPIFTKDVMRLFGYYLSEGYIIAKGNAVAFAFNKREKKTIGDIKSLLSRLTGKQIKDRTRDNVCEVYCCSKKWASFLKSHCGSLARKKSLSKDVMLLPYDKQKEMIKTYLIGDGDFYRRRPGDSFTYRAVTTSSCLAIQIQEMLARGGIFASIKATVKKGHKIEGRESKPSRMYIISFKLEREHEFVHRVKDYFLVPIGGVKNRLYNGAVYNLQVHDEPNSYLVKGFAVHNCGAAIATSSMVTELVKGK
ncbi:MAG: iron-sulfur cluster assembly scaffold protein, partial [Candidatus Omnitrophica bacterium]|nr:iron-sulfur cluster assembly scaffold protein [Candidatus Omnitrophota bacterium]